MSRQSYLSVTIIGGGLAAICMVLTRMVVAEQRKGPGPQLAPAALAPGGAGAGRAGPAALEFRGITARVVGSRCVCDAQSLFTRCLAPLSVLYQQRTFRGILLSVAQ